MNEILITLPILIISLIIIALTHFPVVAIGILSILKWMLNYIQPFALEILKHHLAQQAKQ